MIILYILQLFQEDRDFPEAEYPENNIYDQVPGFGNTLLFVSLMVILWFVIGIILAYFVYRDLRKREVSGIPYVILTLFTGIVGLSIYLLVRYNEKCALEEDEMACLLEDEADNSS
jgi:membrane protein YdbS with pleckstrin-like domain